MSQPVIVSLPGQRQAKASQAVCRQQYGGSGGIARVAPRRASSSVEEGFGGTPTGERPPSATGSSGEMPAAVPPPPPRNHVENAEPQPQLERSPAHDTVSVADPPTITTTTTTTTGKTNASREEHHNTHATHSKVPHSHHSKQRPTSPDPWAETAYTPSCSSNDSSDVKSDDDDDDVRRPRQPRTPPSPIRDSRCSCSYSGEDEDAMWRSVKPQLSGAAPIRPTPPPERVHSLHPTNSPRLCSPMLHEVADAEVPRVPITPLADRLTLQRFGCCVFFFPTPLVSWLFPFIGQVGISNAEGTKLYTFESKYFVREEYLSEVLHLILEEPSAAPPTSAPRLERRGASPMASRTAHLSSPSSRLPDMGDAAARAKAAGHRDATRVRVWDLKPLLMESRGKRAKRLPLAASLSSSPVHSLDPAELCARFHDAMVHRYGARYSKLFRKGFPGPSGSQEDSSEEAESAINTSGDFGVADSIGLASSDGDDDAYELLDGPTARFFNRSLQASIAIFRGSPNGSNCDSADLLLQSRSSFSFVGFVLEACSIGSLRRRTKTVPLADGEAGGASPVDSPTKVVEEEELTMHWGMTKLLFNVALFGEWRCRSLPSRWSFVHAGSYPGSLLLWCLLLLGVMYVFFYPA